MALPRYIELRAHSAFSFLAGASLPEELVERAAALGYPAIALGDRDGVYGAPRLHQAAKQAGIRALIGVELTMEPELPKREDPSRNFEIRNSKFEFGSAPPSLYLLAATRTGYQNLCRLITQTKLRAKKGESVTTWEDMGWETRNSKLEIRNFSATEGLICLAGGLNGPIAALRSWPPPRSSPAHGNVRGRGGLLPSPVASSGNGGGAGRGPDLDSLIKRLQSLFPHRLYIDVQRHLDPEEERFNRTLVDIARHYGIPLVATNDVRHASRNGKPLLDVLTCIREKTTLDAAGRLLLKNAERHLKSPAAMANLFRDLPDAIANTERIAEECEFTLADLGYRFPDYPLPAGETPIGHLRELTYRGARERYGRITPRVRRQLEHELAVIGKLDLAGYFLIVWDIVRFCREQRILAQGRGSAANSAVCYALGITAVDAVGMDLLFERFLSEERGEWPDIDIDLPSGDQREKVIQHVYERYGERGAAMTANVITYRTRSAVREVGKALGFSLEQVDRLSKLLRRFEFRDGSDDLAQQLRAGGTDPDAPRVRLPVDLAQRIRNLPRHLGQHSGGMIIAAGRLDHVAPLEPASMPGRVVVQWDKDDCADLGIIKVDLLGLGMLAVLEEAIPLVREHEGVEVDLAHLPQDDPKVYGMLRKADTIGVFQVESRAQMATLPRLKPDHFYDLVVEVALIRPGPIVGQMVHPYLRRRNGREAVSYAHPDLKPILKRTLGVPLFQEQLLRMAMVLAGFSGGEAEELRRAMGFKRSTQRMHAIEKKLRAGMTARGIRGKTQDDIVRSITSFALYGFPESHAASFALIAYASAYLRAHHLAAFTCAMLNNWPLGFYHPATLVKDAQRHGLRVLPVDVTRSGWKCTLEEQAVTLLGCDVARQENVLSPPKNPATNNPTGSASRPSVRLRSARGSRQGHRGGTSESAVRLDRRRHRALRIARQRSADAGTHRRLRGFRTQPTRGVVAGECGTTGHTVRTAVEGRQSKVEKCFQLFDSSTFDFRLSTAAHVPPRPFARRLQGHRHDRRSADRQAPAHGPRPGRCAACRRCKNGSQRALGEDRRPRDRAPAAGHGERDVLPHPRGRNRHGERRRAPGHLSTAPRAHSHRRLPARRRSGAERRRRRPRAGPPPERIAPPATTDRAQGQRLPHACHAGGAAGIYGWCWCE
jgi:error-prone DNA polymerase